MDDSSCVANPDQKIKHSSQKIKHSSEKTSHRIRCRDFPLLCYYNLCRKMRACFSKIEHLYFKLPDAAKSTFRPPQSSQVLLNHPGNQILVLTPSVSDEQMMKQNQIFDDPYHQKIKLHVQFGYVYKIVFCFTSALRAMFRQKQSNANKSNLIGTLNVLYIFVVVATCKNVQVPDPIHQIVRTCQCDM